MNVAVADLKSPPARRGEDAPSTRLGFRVLGHACLEVQYAGRTLLIDPWLVGSAYWRSWWNYPPVPAGLLDSLAPDYIYLSHLHWDHFHGATLRKLGVGRTVLAPRTPDTRMADDLAEVGFSRLVELRHGKPYELFGGLRITSYQFGIFTDSAIVIEAGDMVLLNLNDAKIIGPPLQEILRRHPRIDVLFKSHSSANSRVCYELVDRQSGHIDDLEKYSREFHAYCELIRPRIAIPFASNQCYLHDETIGFNKIINFAPNVAAYMNAHAVPGVEVVICAPGDSYHSASGFTHTGEDWYGNFDERIAAYRASVQPKLQAYRVQERIAKVTEQHIAPYATKLFAGTPLPLRWLFRGKPICLQVEREGEVRRFRIDLWRRTWADVSMEVPESACLPLIRIPSIVLRLAIERKNWNSVGISKRVVFRCSARDAKYIGLFLMLNNLFDYRLLPLRECLNRRFVAVWASRWREFLTYPLIAYRVFVKGNADVGAMMPRRRASVSVPTPRRANAEILP